VTLHSHFSAGTRECLLASPLRWHDVRVSEDEPVTLYPFRLRNPVTGKWHLARWKATAEEIAEQGGVIDGSPVTYRSRGATSNFQPFGPRRVESSRLEMHPQRGLPGIDAMERFLAVTFLRRYVTYCTRRRQYGKAQGAAELWRTTRICTPPMRVSLQSYIRHQK
jgi:hypothetical protein